MGCPSGHPKLERGYQDRNGYCMLLYVAAVFFAFQTSLLFALKIEVIAFFRSIQLVHLRSVWTKWSRSVGTVCCSHCHWRLLKKVIRSLRYGWRGMEGLICWWFFLLGLFIVIGFIGIQNCNLWKSASDLAPRIDFRSPNWKQHHQMCQIVGLSMPRVVQLHVSDSLPSLLSLLSLLSAQEVGSLKPRRTRYKKALPSAFALLISWISKEILQVFESTFTLPSSSKSFSTFLTFAFGPLRAGPLGPSFSLHRNIRLELEVLPVLPIIILRHQWRRTRHQFFWFL